MRALAVLAVIFLIVPLLLLAAGQFGFLRGSPPGERGLRDGKLKPPSRTTNSVSSQADSLAGGRIRGGVRERSSRSASRGDAVVAMNRLRDVLKAWPGATIVEDRPELHRGGIRDALAALRRRRRVPARPRASA